MNGKIFLLVVVAISSFIRSNGNKNSKAKDDCVGTIGFSSSEVSKVHSTGLLQYKTNIYDSNHGWNRDTGTFTVKCPGVYSVSFSGYGAEDAKFALRKRTAISNEFITIVSTPPGGGANSIIIMLNEAEQLSMVVTGHLRPDLESTGSVNSFTLFRISE